MAAEENKTRLRDEVAALSKTVCDLRDEVARLRAGQHGCGCAHVCAHVCTHPAWQSWWWQPATTTITAGTGPTPLPYTISY